jgi:hypothetical protein
MSSRGSNNTGLGYKAGSELPDTSGNTNSDNCVFLGSSTKPLATGQTNQIVIGYNAIGNGSNSVTLGNNDITKTILKGNVGIGTTSPSARLDVGYVAGGVALRVERDSNNRLDFYQGGGVSYIDSSAASSQLAFATVGSERMRITSAGNVGIGTTSPTGQSSDNRVLQIYGAGTGNRAQLHLVNSNTGEGTNDGSFIGIDSSTNLYINNTESAATIFENAGAERMRITSGGNVLIGTTTDNGYKLQVNGNISAQNLFLTGIYSVEYTTDSSWTSYQNIINPALLSANVTYLIKVDWFYGGASNQPYYYSCSFLWSGVTTNGSGTENENTPIGSTHTGGTGSTISFRSIAGTSSTSGLQARLNGFATTGGTLVIKVVQLA